jgi:hypothetical protein
VFELHESLSSIMHSAMFSTSTRVDSVMLYGRGGGQGEGSGIRVGGGGNYDVKLKMSRNE